MGEQKDETNHSYETLEYSAPEYWKGSLRYSVDFWALGIIVYKMLTGNFPFLSIDSILTDEIPDIQNLVLTNEAQQFIKDLLIKEKDERLGSRKNNKNVKEHPFFESINWNKVENGELEPPFKPIEVIYFNSSTFKFKIK